MSHNQCCCATVSDVLIVYLSMRLQNVLATIRVDSSISKRPWWSSMLVNTLDCTPLECLSLQRQLRRKPTGHGTTCVAPHFSATSSRNTHHMRRMIFTTNWSFSNFCSLIKVGGMLGSNAWLLDLMELQGLELVSPSP